MSSKQVNRRSSYKRRTSSTGNTPIQAMPPVQPRTNATMVRRRVSVSMQESEIIDSPKPTTPPPTNLEVQVPKTADLIRRSESYAFDSSSDEDGDNEVDNPPPRALAFGNARYMLQSFESGHWSMAGGRSDVFDSGNSSYIFFC